MNWDEENNYKIAQEHKEKGVYPQFAYHGTGTVYIYEFLMLAGISKKNYIIVIFVLQNLLYIWSIFIFKKLADYFLTDLNSSICALTYAYYPSVIYYVGGIFAYENIATYLLIYCILKLIRFIIENKIDTIDIILFPIIITISCYIRGQLILFYLLIFIVLWIIVLYKKLKFLGERNITRLLYISTATFLLMFFAHYPILLKNEKLFNKKILSTQTGFELLQGHNPFASGLWNKRSNLPNDSLYQYCKKKIPNENSLNQYQVSLIRKNLAFEWIKKNPMNELFLEIKKLTIYFSPLNCKSIDYDTYVYVNNFFSFLIQILFLVCMISLIKNLQIDSRIILIFIPILVSILLSIIFFVGMRWRFYAEPFMIIFAFLFLSKHIDFKKYLAK